MIYLDIAHFVKLAYSSEVGAWDEESTRRLAALSPPDVIGGTAYWLLFGDAKALWARWFLEAFGDPQYYFDGRLNYPRLFKQVLENVSDLANLMPADERVELSKVLAQLLWVEMRRRASIRRVRARRDLRLLLRELYPRCWVCGASFPNWATAAFLGSDDDRTPVGLPFVDYYKPRGAKAIDLKVEIEHVMPLASGGSNDIANLRLACGWCNRVKGSRTLLYDAEGKPRVFDHPSLGKSSIPQPFWVVRLLAMRPRCEDPSGCTANVREHELTVAPYRLRGVPNPANLKVVCREHDPLVNVRLVPASLFA